MNSVALSICEELNFDVSGSFKETLDEHCAITKSGFCFAYGALESVLEIRLLSYNTHSAATATHGSFDDD